MKRTSLSVAASATIGGIGGNGNGYVTMTGGSLDGAAIDGGYGMQEVIGIAPGGSGIFTQSGGTNMSMVHFYDSQRYFSALSLGFVPGAFGQYNLQGGHLNAPAIFVGGNTNQVQDHTVSDAGTGVFVQTGGSVGTLAVAGAAPRPLVWRWAAIGWARPLTRARLYTTWPSGHTPSAAPAAGRRSWSAASKASGLAAPALSPKIPAPTTSSAEGPKWAIRQYWHPL